MDRGLTCRPSQHADYKRFVNMSWLLQPTELIAEAFVKFEKFVIDSGPQMCPPFTLAAQLLADAGSQRSQ